MDNTASVSKGCFVFKPKDEGKKKKSKKYHDVLDFSSELWFQSYSGVWKNISEKLEAINKRVSDVVLLDLQSFISECEVLTQTIHTAVLLMGVNLPDHNALFTSLASRLQNNLTPNIALLQSEDCNSVKNTIEQMVAQFLKGTKILDENEMMDIDSSDSEVTNVKKSDCTLPNLLKWHQETNRNKKDLYKLIVILKDFEGFSSKVLADLILILSQYSTRLPIVLVMGVATTATALHRTLPHNVTSKLNLRMFQSKPSVYFLNNTLDNVFLKGDCPFQLGMKIFKFLTDVFLYYDFSVDGFIKGIKYCVMEHFYSTPTSVLCCLPTHLDEVIESLDEDYLKEFQKLSSFQAYFNKLPKQKQMKITSSTATLKFQLYVIYSDDGGSTETRVSKIKIKVTQFKKKKLLKKLMLELWENLSSFYIFVRLLHILVADLPNAPLGKQVREIYSETVSVKVTNNSRYSECFKILGFIAKDELVDKLNKMLKVIDDSSNISEQVKSIKIRLRELTTDVEKVGFESLTHTPTKSPSKEKFNLTSRAQFREHLEKLSQTVKPKNAYEAARANVLDYLKDEVFEQNLLPITSLTLHEVILFDNIGSVKRHIIGSPRAAIHTALNNPHHYLQCDCCKISNDGEILPTMPDICIAYKLHLESGSLINMYDWLQSFATVIDPENVKRTNQKDDADIQARFTQAVAELQFLGFIKSSKKKTDHVTRLTWGGSS